jgi:hypothetical protein
MSNGEIGGLLCAGSTRYHEMLGSSSRVGKLSKAELAGLLSGMNKQAINLFMAKYMLDLDAERRLIAHVRVWAAGVAGKYNWKVVKGRPTVVNLAALAVFETVRPNRCERCGGRGILSVKACAACVGTGYKYLSRRKIAEAVGLSESTYREIWRERYTDVFRYVQRIDVDINIILKTADREKVLEFV